MNLKKVVGLISVLGVVSVPAFAVAATTPAASTSATQAATATAAPAAPAAATTAVAPVAPMHHHHHRHHKKMVAHHVMHRHVEQVVVARTDYKADYKEEEMPAQPAACEMSPNDMVLDQVTQSMNRAMPNPCAPGWFNRIQLSGGMNFDVGKWGNRDANFMGENYQHFALNDAYLNVGATVNDWTKAFASISFDDATTNGLLTNAQLVSNGQTVFVRHNAEYSAAYANNVASFSNSNTLQLEQAYATFGNFDVSPFYIQVGKQFQDFGRYDIHPITESLTQVMSETLATSAKLGFVAYGFNGSVAVFDDQLSLNDDHSKPTNYVASLGFATPTNQPLNWDIGVGWMYNMIGANSVAYNVAQYSILNNGSFFYHEHVGSGAAYGDLNAGPFSLNLRYVTSLDEFNPLDLPRNGDEDVIVVNNNGVPALVSDAEGARPSSWGAQAGYDFNVWCKDQSIYVGYQGSNQAAGLLLPKDRWLAGYQIVVAKAEEPINGKTTLGIEWDHDRAYSNGINGDDEDDDGDNTNLVTLRAAVQFN